MRQTRQFALVLAFVSGTALTTTAFAAGLLGNGGLVDIDSGPAGNDAAVNIGLGSGGGNSGNVVDLNVGGGNTPAVQANVSSGGSSGSALGVDANVGDGLATGNVDVGRNGGSTDVNVDLGVGNGLVNGNVDVGLGTDIGVDVGIGIGDPSTGGPGTGGPGTGGPGTGGPGVIPGTGVGSNGGSDGAACIGEDGNTLLRLAQRGGYNARAVAGWQRASGVQILPVQVCPEVKAALASHINAGPLQSAVSADALISTSLSRTRYDADNVFAVIQKGSQLQVYVY